MRSAVVPRFLTLLLEQSCRMSASGRLSLLPGLKIGAAMKTAVSCLLWATVYLLKLLIMITVNLRRISKQFHARLDGLTEVKDNMFYNSKLPVNIVLPDTVKKIGDYAFYYATNLEGIVIPDSVTEIGERAFYGCASLKSVALPSGLSKISDYAFYGCSSLTSVIIPKEVSVIGKYAFYNCLALDNIEVPSSVVSIGEYAFTHTAWIDGYADKFLIVGDGLLLKYRAFEDETVFASGDPIVKAIVGGAFEGTYRLKKITLPDTVTSIDAYAFSGCTTVEEIVSSAISVGERAFNNCMALKKVAFADDNAQIAEDAFNGCTAYKK